MPGRGHPGGGAVVGGMAVIGIIIALTILGTMAPRKAGPLVNEVVAATPKALDQSECYALAAFTEARSEGVAGMAAVVEVVRTRMGSTYWPAGACAVVFQPSQFLGVNGWTPERAHARNAEAWDAALYLSNIAIAGMELVPADCRGATHFDQARHTKGLTPLCRIGVHQFYREDRS